DLRRVHHASGEPGGARHHRDYDPRHPVPAVARRASGAAGVKRLATPLMAVAIFLLNVWLNAPLFMAGDLPFPGSIERGYVSMARFVAQHPNPSGWNPYPYCGLPTGFMYVPGLPYLTALGIHLLPHLTPDTIYRTIVSFNTCLGPVTLFLFAVYFTGSRKWSFVAALSYSL